jgi:3-methyladenine DNA glycosylase Mpg
MKQKGDGSAVLFRGLKPRENTQEKARRSHEGCTGPDVDRRVLRGDGRSCAGREGLSRLYLNNRGAYWFRLLHNSLNRNQI